MSGYCEIQGQLLTLRWALFGSGERRVWVCKSHLCQNVRIFTLADETRPESDIQLLKLIAPNQRLAL